MTEQEGREIIVRGTVQGVGFRPFVFRTASRRLLVGQVQNSSQGVHILVQGRPEDLDRFTADLREQAPPLAVIRDIQVNSQPFDAGLKRFSITASGLGESPEVDIARDTATCGACRQEMLSADNRRYLHPFINCTDCGPRYTIIKSLPYDRSRTTMSGFEMCPSCKTEYGNPHDRRFHAQPVCCPECGLQLQLLNERGAPTSADDPTATAIGMLAEGKILAVKGLGGFHLACRADSEEAAAELRRRKHREEKPLAVMAKNIESVRRHCHVSEHQELLLRGPERPIVILDKKEEGDQLASGLAPRVPTLGVMLPYTPLHHLLFDTGQYSTLVMTSGNQTDEPICISTAEAVDKLSGIADGFLTHNRPIHIRVDDSLTRMLGNEPVLLRRSRGYVPSHLGVEVNVNGIAALGGILKSTVTVGREYTCYVSHYLGSADNTQTVENCRHVLHHLLGVLGVKPELMAADLHPGGLQKALISEGIPLVKVQHHHAHAAACLAEDQVQEKAVCLVYDGLGLGDDGTIWGGEILLADQMNYQRIGHLSSMLMPGGDAATLNPGRMALGALWETLGEETSALCSWMPEEEKRAVMSLLASGLNCPRTTSMGRLFDALAALLDVCRRRTYEGQPAMELEGAADRDEHGSYSMPLENQDDILILNGSSLLEQALEDASQGIPARQISTRFHHAVADASVQAAVQACNSGTSEVVLSGGCFQNALLFERTVKGLKEQGPKTHCHRRLSPGDECISLGQAVIAAWRREAGTV